MKDVDDLAQFIRRVDGNHTMGAGALAEVIVAYQVEALLADDAIERAARAWSATCEAGRAGPGYRDAWRAALTAALGIEGDESNE